MWILIIALILFAIFGGIAISKLLFLLLLVALLLVLFGR